MNIFVLDRDPGAAAMSLCDRHVVKMALETAQLLSTALSMHGVSDAKLYRSTHKAHPCTIWTAASRDNFVWLINHGLEICYEYSRRYGREHASRRVILEAADCRDRIPAMGMTPFAQAMPDKYKTDDPVASYRAYYIGEKAGFASWKAPAAVPCWWKGANA
jgi:hypothetical protein